ncbi:hypothetical protein AAZX31_01G009700 [Glycine max]|uniref:50S ribosomal protein L35 n=2 Tax=Glycine subgen. Soja TaxID=1462606 RepID=C6TM71_SOYBN|nr:uncharacterized protein LOC100814427 [Glycine max]XP_028226938.1 uncharacterized protein LOC114407858 [Glycine soja]ACU24013.1 unknown [Glycine max]KAG5067716.1 hypothetical protein JHK85_000093 [Glycine max]KAG5087479.1 hypothetical protein JHK86_000091 [Glycine max]KAH1161036.1 hypothetical protein GYH30_000099 [Glycine max]KAH1264116.1 hypothetical protein GmHk_01G000095 [Glycine max]|eukprot:NP_001240123.1 uncharacterized protein LOC100814427 [Glycine max]
MLRSLTKLRCFAAVQSRQVLSPPSSRRLLHHSPPPQPLHSASNFRISRPSFISSSWPLHASHPSPSLVQVRHASSKERKRKPVPPTVSKVKKTKMKSYSSFKSRFRTMNDGNIRRWKEGKRHNAHLKSKKSKRRLRKPGIVPVAYAKVMKKLNFSA